MSVKEYEVVEMDIYNQDKFIKNVPHKVVTTPSGTIEYRHSLEVVYRIAAICDHLNQVGKNEFDYKEIEDYPEVINKLKEAKYI